MSPVNFPPTAPHSILRPFFSRLSPCFLESPLLVLQTNLLFFLFLYFPITRESPSSFLCRLRSLHTLAPRRGPIYAGFPPFLLQRPPPPPSMVSSFFCVDSPVPSGCFSGNVLPQRSPSGCNAFPCLPVNRSDLVFVLRPLAAILFFATPPIFRDLLFFSFPHCFFFLTFGGIPSFPSFPHAVSANLLLSVSSPTTFSWIFFTFAGRIAPQFPPGIFFFLFLLLCVFSRAPPRALCILPGRRPYTPCSLVLYFVYGLFFRVRLNRFWE